MHVNSRQSPEPFWRETAGKLNLAEIVGNPLDTRIKAGCHAFLLVRGFHVLGKLPARWTLALAIRPGIITRVRV